MKTRDKRIRMAEYFFTKCHIMIRSALDSENKSGAGLKKLFVRIFGSEVYYIGTALSLPPPLDAESEAELLFKLAQNGDEANEARSQLIERNLRLVVYIAKKFENTHIALEDLVSIGTIGLVKAINTFDTGKNIKLATYASRCIENEILMYIRKSASQKNELSLDEPLNVDWDGNELLLSDVLGTDPDTVHHGIEEEQDRQIILSAIEKLPKREREIIVMRFGIGSGEEKTQKEVADMLGISQSYISRLEKKIIDKLKLSVEKYFM